MTKLLQFAVCFVLIAFASVAGAAVLTFEDLSGSGPVPDPYQGIINWENSTWSYYDREQWPYTPHSGNVRLLELSQKTPSWWFIEPTVFNGAWFSGYAKYGAKVQMDLYYLGALVHSTPELYPNEVPAFLSSGYSGLVDYVVVNTPGGGNWVMDDITYGNAVPLPGAAILLGSGLAGLAAMRRKSR